MSGNSKGYKDLTTSSYTGIFIYFLFYIIGTNLHFTVTDILVRQCNESSKLNITFKIPSLVNR